MGNHDLSEYIRPVVVGTSAELAGLRTGFQAFPTGDAVIPVDKQLIVKVDDAGNVLSFGVGDGVTDLADLPMTAVGGGGGGGATIPLATPNIGYTVDTTTYNDPVLNDGTKMTTLVYPADAADAPTVLYAVAIEGDTHPRQLVFADPGNGGGVDFGDGTNDPWNEQSAGWVISPNGDGSFALHIVAAAALNIGDKDPDRGPVTTTGGAFVFGGAGSSGAAILSGTGVPVCGGRVGDVYIQTDGDDGSWIYRCTTAGAPGDAVWAAKL